jgi:hypothetical protein
MENQTIIEDLTLDNVGTLTETQVSEIANTIEKEPEKEKRSQLMKILETAFEFRTISAKNRNLKADLSFMGYRFFPVEQNKVFLRGIRKKTNRRY